MPQEQAASILAKLRIFHPYGTVGSLPWQNGPNSVPFGTNELKETELLNLALGIRTFTESIDEGKDIEAIRSAILEAQTIIFLGFAFHLPNMNLIQPAHPSKNSKNIFGSTFGISASDGRIIENSIRKLHGREVPPSYIGTAGIVCHRLFEEYWHHFSEA